MGKERALIKDMKVLLECTDMGSLQRNTDVLIGRAIELLAQPEPSLTGDQLIDMWRDGYDAGARLAHPEQEQEPVAWIDAGSLESLQANRGYALRYLTNDAGDINVDDVPLYLAPPPPKREPLSDREISHGFRSNKDATNAESYWAGVEYAERCHGIGGDVQML